MQEAETVLAVLRERGRKGLPCNELYRQMFNKELYLLAFFRINFCPFPVYLCIWWRVALAVTEGC